MVFSATALPTYKCDTSLERSWKVLKVFVKQRHLAAAYGDFILKNWKQVVRSNQSSHNQNFFNELLHWRFFLLYFMKSEFLGLRTVQKSVLYAFTPNSWTNQLRYVFAFAFLHDFASHLAAYSRSTCLRFFNPKIIGGVVWSSLAPPSFFFQSVSSSLLVKDLKSTETKREPHPLTLNCMRLNKEKHKRTDLHHATTWIQRAVILISPSSY